MNLLPEAPSPQANREPLYNIGVVTRMTGISMATLRAWERRYDFPEASRTSGGHRLYSEYDILRLRWVKARIEEGMQTAQAIQALRHQEALGITPGATPGATPSESALPGATIARPTPAALEPSPLLIYQERLFSALVQRDLQKADQLLSEALALSTVEDLILHLIGPVIARIGEAWEHNQISVAIEHLATNYLRQRLLMWMVGGPPPLPMKPIVLACAPNEWHEGSLLMLGALLRRQRYPVAYLGQAVPLPDLAAFVKQIRPVAIVLVAMTAETAAALADWQRHMPEIAAAGTPPLAFGGRIFTLQPEWRSRVPGLFLGDTIQQGIETLEQLIRSSA